MSGVVFFETLRRGWRTMLYWGLGIASIALTTVVLVQDMDALRQYAQLAETIPPALLNVMGVRDLEILATPEGYLGGFFFGQALLYLAVYCVFAGLNITANEEERGIMDMLLSQPLPRWRLFVEKFAAYALLSAGILLLLLIGLWIGTLFTPVMQIDLGKMTEVTFGLLPPMLVMIAATALFAVLVRRRATALALTAVFIGTSYVLDALGAAASQSALASLRGLSYFSYYNGTEVVLSGLAWGGVALLVGVTALLVAAAVWRFERRDIGL